jgi:hypothetical protein
MAPISKRPARPAAGGSKRPARPAARPASKTGDSKLREENKRLRAEVRGLKKEGRGDRAEVGKKEGGPKQSMKERMEHLRSMRGKKKKS